MNEEKWLNENKTSTLLSGPILPALTKLAIPIMATSLIQMAYNLIDMIWIGKIGSDAVASVGAAGMYMWLANGVSTLPKIGGQIKVGQNMGAGNRKDASKYASCAILVGIIYGVLLALCIFSFATPLIHFLKLNKAHVVSDGISYLRIVSIGIVFSFMNQVLTGLFTSIGNSSISFITTTIGLLINIALDPLLIFGIGFFPAMGVSGAALATIIAQGIVMCLFLLACKRDRILFSEVKILKKPNMHHLIQINKVGLPVSVQSMMFTGISMIIARYVAGFGDDAVAVQKVGSQIESISWMAAEGFSAAVNTFVAQNYGAGNLRRVRNGYKTSMIVVMVWGLICSFLLIVLPEPIFRIFIREAKVIPMGVEYLRIVGYSQLFMCIEITTQGAFGGFGKTIPPFLVGATFTFLRIPGAKLLSRTSLKLNGIWWVISISSMFKGVVLVFWFLLFLRKTLRLEKRD